MPTIPERSTHHMHAAHAAPSVPTVPEPLRNRTNTSPPPDGASRSYKNGPKNNWRRTIANEVLRRTEGRERHQPVLYLSGPEDLDGHCLRQKGVPAQNLIGIDRCRENADRRRLRGLPTYHGEALDALIAWPEDRPVAAVLLDFCQGFDLDAYRTFGVLISRPPFDRTVVMLNMQRGRDAKSNGAREHTNVILRALGCRETRHRAELFVHYFAKIVLAGQTVTRDAYLRAVEEMLRPSFYSYRSDRGLVFDSVVVDLHALHAYVEVQRVDHFPAVSRSSRQRLAAMLAVRTKRINEMGGAR